MLLVIGFGKKERDPEARSIRVDPLKSCYITAPTFRM